MRLEEETISAEELILVGSLTGPSCGLGVPRARQVHICGPLHVNSVPVHRINTGDPA